MTILNSPQERSRFFRFAIVGMIGALVDSIVLNLLTLVFSVEPVIASVFSFLAAVTSNFIWNRYWTFPDSRSKAISHQMVQFVIVNTIGVLIRTPIFASLFRLLLSFFGNVTISLPNVFTPEFMAQNIALAGAIIVVLFWNFSVNRYWTFSDID